MTEHSLWRFSRAFHRALNERQTDHLESILDDEIDWAIYVEMLYPSDFTPPRILAGIMAPLALPICAKVANIGIGSIE